MKSLVLPRTASHGTHVGDDLKFALPANWIDLSLISEKAGKSDDADVPAQLWDNRIGLALRCSTRSLPTLWRFFHALAVRRGG